MPPQDLKRYTEELLRLDEAGRRTYEEIKRLQSLLVEGIQNPKLLRDIQDLKYQLIELEKAYTTTRSLSGGTGGVRGAPPFSTAAQAMPPDEAFNRSRQQVVQKELTAAQKREQAERQRIEALQASIKAELKYARALEIASQQGYSLGNLYQVRTRGTGGVEQLRFQREGALGENRQLDLFVNQAGRATPGISNQFRTFGQGIVRDIGELTKWSIALAAIYGPMRKLSELTQIMIENQTKLAEAAISVSSSFTDQTDIFNAAADAANKSGEAISGVIDAFTQAYRATGGAGDQTTRFATANKLLADALILSKLSTLDQAQAIDTLSAAVRQTGGNFNITTKLLDSWVRVTKNANVDLTTLATGFAVLGDAAETAGLSMDELNGLIAVIAESSQSSGKEVANAARAIVAGLQSEQGRKALEELGIATTTTTGEMRDLQDVLVETFNLIKSGAIGETQLSRLGLQVGGGTRRGAIVTTVLSNYDRALQVSKESAKANGDAEAALAKQLETVQTSITRLGNAFQEWAQTLGTEGGFLSIITASIDGLTKLVNLFDDISSALGKATPALIAFGVASAVLKYQGVTGGVQGALGGIVQPGALDLRLAQVTGASPQVGGARGFLAQNVLGTNLVSGVIQGALASAIPAFLNATNKEDRFGGTKAVADVIGGVGGGIVGSLVAGSPLIGAAVGTAIADAFVNSTVDRKTDLFGYATKPGLAKEPTPTTAKSSQEQLEEALKQAEIGLYKSIGKGSEEAGRIKTSGPYKSGKDLVDQFNKAIEDGSKEELTKAFITAKKNYRDTFRQLEQAGITQQVIEQAFAQRKQIEFKPEYLAFQQATPEAQKTYQQALSRVTATGEVAGTETPFSNLVAQNTKQFSELLTTLRERSRTELTQQRIGGEVTGAEYARRVTALGGFDTKALQYYTQLGDQISLIGKDVDSASDAFEILNRIIVTGAGDSVPEITQLGGEIEHLINLLNDPALKEDLIKAGGVDAVTKQIEDLRGAMAQLVSQANEKALLQGLKIPEVRGDINKPLTTQQFYETQQRATKLQDEFYRGFLKIPDDMYNALKDSFEEFATIIKGSGDEFYQKVSQIDPKFWQEALQEVTGGGQFNIQTLDIPSSEKGRLQQRIDYFNQFLQKNFPKYQLNDEKFGVIFKDNVTDILHGDNLAIRLALDELNQTARKQLDGIYNLPEGATGWVPYQLLQALGGGGTPTTGGELTGTMAFKERTGITPPEGWTGDIGVAPRQAQALPPEPRPWTGDTGQAPRPEESILERQKREFLQQEHEGGAYTPSTTSEGAEQVTPAIINLAAQLGALVQAIGQLGGIFGSSIAGGAPSSFQNSQQAQPIPQVTNKLDLSVESTTTLTVDGQVLANIVKQYLAQDLLAAAQSQSSIVRRVVI